MEAERKQEANRLRASGAADSERIRAEADRKRQEILARAYAEAQAKRGEGDATAAAIYAKSYGQDPEFYSFYKSLDAYRSAFADQNGTLVLSPDSDFFRFWDRAAGGQSAAQPAVR
jgi:membrane protease subunit HflC